MGPHPRRWQVSQDSYDSRGDGERMLQGASVQTRMETELWAGGIRLWSPGARECTWGWSGSLGPLERYRDEKQWFEKNSQIYTHFKQLEFIFNSNIFRFIRNYWKTNYVHTGGCVCIRCMHMRAVSPGDREGVRSPGTGVIGSNFWPGRCCHHDIHPHHGLQSNRASLL